MKKKLLYSILGLMFIFTVFNPSLDDFKDYGHLSWATKERDFIIFSIYWDKDGPDNNAETVYYLGMLKNFWEVKREPPELLVTPARE